MKPGSNMQHSAWSRRATIPLEGVRIGPYEIRGVLGSGGVGMVFRARDTDLDRDVALKLLRDGRCAGAMAADDLVEEARALAAVRHPNVVQVHALGREQGRIYFVMELFEGGSLLQRIQQREHGLPLSEALPILCDVARGLAAIHATGRTHGDVKPSNVLFSEGRAALADLGLSQAIERTFGLQLRGSPAYLCPERIRNDETDPALRPRQDVYGLGVTAFETLTGRLPFDGTSSLEILDRHLDDPVPLVSTVAPHLGSAFDGPFHSAMAKDPSERMATATEFVEALEAAARATAPGGRPLQLLVVDDDDEWRAILQRVLSRRLPGARVASAASGERAVEVARQQPPDLAFIDLDLPGLDGIELSRHLLRPGPDGTHPHVIVMSGYGGAREWQQLSQHGADRFFVKPVSPEALVDAALELLDQR